MDLQEGQLATLRNFAFVLMFRPNRLSRSALASTLLCMHESSPLNRLRYKVVFGKDAQDLQAKLNDPDFVPSGYTVTHLTFNSARAEYLVILEDEGSQDR